MGNANRSTYRLTGKTTQFVFPSYETDLFLTSFGRGEAAVSIVLKPLDAALRDHDKVYATVRQFFQDISL